MAIDAALRYYQSNMGYDFTTQSFDASNHELLPAQMIPEVREMLPSSIAYFDLDEMVIDRDGKLWINGNTHTWTREEVEEDIIDDDFNIGRIICIEEGLIVDASHYDKTSYTSLDSRFIRRTLELVMADADEDFVPLPVIHFIGNKTELELIETTIQDGYNVDLVGSELDGELLGEYIILLDDYDLEDD